MMIVSMGQRESHDVGYFQLLSINIQRFGRQP